MQEIVGKKHNDGKSLLTLAYCHSNMMVQHLSVRFSAGSDDSSSGNKDVPDDEESFLCHLWIRSFTSRTGALIMTKLAQMTWGLTSQDTIQVAVPKQVRTDEGTSHSYLNSINLAALDKRVVFLAKFTTYAGMFDKTPMHLRVKSAGAIVVLFRSYFWWKAKSYYANYKLTHIMKWEHILSSLNRWSADSLQY